ncbi:hypothetical protein [Streptosporangium sp. H16]|uniref:hypothetical protein n=1 Tax=Streptosporangium sp. H16 TaxID=3444184 RepID=UPI003F79C7D9
MSGTLSKQTTPLSPSAVIPVTEAAVIAAFARRDHAGHALAGDVERIACAARAMAAGFRLGGKLIVFGGTGTDAAHIAVEFMHPVIVGKRALPAVALSNGAPAAGRVSDQAGRRNGDGSGSDGGFQKSGDLQKSGNLRKGGDGEGSTEVAEVFAHQVRHWADAADTALGISRDGRCPSVLRGLETAGELGLLTIALTGGGGRGEGDGIANGTASGGLPADRTLTGRLPAGHTMTGRLPAGHTMTGRLPADHVLVAASDDPAVVKEVHVTAYHLLWELVHVFLDRLGPPARGAGR